MSWSGFEHSRNSSRDGEPVFPKHNTCDTTPAEVSSKNSTKSGLRPKYKTKHRPVNTPGPQSEGTRNVRLPKSELGASMKEIANKNNETERLRGKKSRDRKRIQEYEFIPESLHFCPDVSEPAQSYRDGTDGKRHEIPTRTQTEISRKPRMPAYRENEGLYSGCPNLQHA